jgi:hypothetical protein
MNAECAMTSWRFSIEVGKMSSSRAADERLNSSARMRHAARASNPPAIVTESFRRGFRRHATVDLFILST